MGYRNLKECVEDLEKHGHLVRVTEEVDGELEMASIHRRVFEAGGPAILFEKIKGNRFQAVSNLFGTPERSRFMFRDSLEQVKTIIDLKGDPSGILKQPWKIFSTGWAAFKALPRKVGRRRLSAFTRGSITDLPWIKSWPMDGGPFITLPIVYTEDPDKPGVFGSNIGMYRIQLAGNDYRTNEEIGLHYQIHRGIGVHQSKWNSRGEPMKVSIFVGGPPSLSFSAVMPLPEGMPEFTFAGLLGGRRMRYVRDNGYCYPVDADFIINGEVYPGENKPEGPFGDHLGYYSLTHDFPLMRVKEVLYKKDAIWSFTVVGRPPQEDTSFGALIHELTGDILPKEVPGLKEVHAVDAAGVHPLLLAIGSERYTPYMEVRQPQEILTIANHILGTGQMSLAKYVFIAAREDAPQLSTHREEEFFRHMLERVDWMRDLHFHTNTSIDTLDYSGTSLNAGSKLVVAAVGNPKRTLGRELPLSIVGANLPFEDMRVAAPGILALQAGKFTGYEKARQEGQEWDESLKPLIGDLAAWPLIILCDDAEFVSASWKNLIWVTFTRSNPSHDIYGVGSFTEFKHWGCRGPLIIDARIKPHHAPPLIEDPGTEERVNRLGLKGASLYGII